MGSIDKPFIRSIKINDEEIFFEIIVSFRAKHTRLQIMDNKLQLIIPRGVGLYEVEDFIKAKIGWIKKNLGKSNHNSGKIFFLGKEINIKQEFEPSSRHHKVRYTNGELRIVSPSNSKTDTKKIYSTWLREQAKEYIAPRAYKLARENNFVVNNISIRGQKTRWGSCSSRCNLSFNYKLMQYRKEVIDYVIFHELCHLIEMNHSKGFWFLMKKFCPDYKLLKKELKNGTNI